jgi:hypothetical protein
MQWMMLRQFVAVSFSVLLCVESVDARAYPGQQELRIVVLQGDGSTNDTKKRDATPLVVQVQNADGPVAGAQVRFEAPATGAGGTFPNAAKTIAVSTDQTGIAQVTGFRPNTTAGSFEIKVSASYRTIQGTTSIFQTNSAPKGGSKKWIAILVAAGGAAGAAVLLGGKSQPADSNTPPPSGTLTAGSPSVSAP